MAVAANLVVIGVGQAIILIIVSPLQSLSAISSFETGSTGDPNPSGAIAVKTSYYASGVPSMSFNSSRRPSGYRMSIPSAVAIHTDPSDNGRISFIQFFLLGKGCCQ